MNIATNMRMESWGRGIKGEHCNQYANGFTKEGIKASLNTPTED